MTPHIANGHSRHFGRRPAPRVTGIPEFRSRSREQASSASRPRNNSPLDEAIFPASEDRLKSMPDNNAARSNNGFEKIAANLHTPEIGRTAMKRSLLMVALLTLACAATLAPIKSTPPMLLSDAGG